MIGQFKGVYISEVVLKFKDFDSDSMELEKSFFQMRKHQLKMSCLQYVFGVSVGSFLSFRGMEVDKNLAKTIIQTKSPSYEKYLQLLLCHIVQKEVHLKSGKKK